MPPKANRISKKLRFCSAMMAVLSLYSTFGGVAAMAEEAGSNAAVEEAAVSQEVPTEKASSQIEAEAASSAASSPEEAASEPTGSQPETEDGSSSAPEQKIALDVAEDGSLSGTLPDGASITVDADGNAVLDLSGVESADSAQEMESGVAYQDSATGATVYKMEDFLNESEPDADYEDDTDAFMAWMDTPVITPEELSAAMEKASGYDEAVLQNYYEPVTGKQTARQTARQPIVVESSADAQSAASEMPESTAASESAESAPESASQEEAADAAMPEEPTAAYRLKDEYAAPVPAEEDIAFSPESDIALQSGDYQGATQSATIMVIGSSSLYLRVVDENGNGLTGASVTYSLDGGRTMKFGTTQTLADENAQTAGMLKLDTAGMKTDNATLFVNISKPGYYGITRLADLVEVGSVLTYTLCEQDPNASGVYLRGSYIDSVSTSDGYTLMLTAKNTKRYHITAIVGVAGSTQMSDMPQTLTMRTSNQANPGYGSKAFTSDEAQVSDNYAVYHFTDAWSHYTDRLSQAVLRKGDTLYLDKAGTASWLTITKAEGTTQAETADTISMGITAELPDLDYIGIASNLSFGLCGTNGASITLPNDYLGGDSTIDTDLLSVPVFFYVSLQGSVFLGFGPVLNLAETQWLQDTNNNPQAQNPGTQAKTEKLFERIKKQTTDAFDVKEAYQEKQKRRANLNDKMKDAKQNGKKVMATASGSVDWTGAVFLIGRYDLRNYRASLDLGVEMNWIGDVQATAYLLLGPVPVYVGVEFVGTGGGSAVVGVQTGNLQTNDFWDLSQWSLSNTSSFTINAMIMLEAVIGVGQRGVIGLEGFANGSVAGALKAQNISRPAGAFPLRFQAMGNVSAGLRARLFFLTYTKSWSLVDSLLYDSWGIYDSGDPDTPGTPEAQMAKTRELPDYSILLADPEVRAAAAKAENQDYAVYAESLDGIEPEVNIAENGTQQDLRANEPAMLRDETAGQSTVTGTSTLEKAGVMTGSDFQYVSDGKNTYLFRIATAEMQGVGKVARVVYSKGDANGQSSEVTALPFTQEKYDLYGYDTNFAVAMSSSGESDIAYIAIVSVPLMENMTDVAAQAAKSRLRVICMNLRTGEILSNTLVEKAPLNGKKDYAYTGTPTVFGYQEKENGGYYGTYYRSKQAYMVACTVTSDTAALANGTLTNGNDAVAIATNRSSDRMMLGKSDGNGSTVWQDGIRRTNLTFTNVLGEGYLYSPYGTWGLVSVDADQPQTLDILDISCWNPGPDSKRVTVKPNTRLSVPSGIISNLQHPSQNYANELHFTCEGNLYMLEHEGNEYKGFQQLTEKTDVGDDVVLPSGDGLMLLGLQGDSAENMMAVFTTARGREETDENGQTQTLTDMVVRVYTLMARNGGGYTVSGPRESVIENRAPVKTTVVGIQVGEGGNNLVRMMYLANQNFVATSQPSGSIADGSYTAGTAQDTSDLYMWELRPGRAAELGGFTPTATTIQKNKDEETKLACDININNVGSYALKNVTVEVHKDSPAGALVGSYIVQTKGEGFQTLGPGSDMNTQIEIPLGADWDGAVTLYAAITRADGQTMSADYTPVWIGADQLIKEGNVTMAVTQTATDYRLTRTINGKTYTFSNTIANIRIGYKNRIDPRKFKVRIKTMRFGTDGKEKWDTETKEIFLRSTPLIIKGGTYNIGLYMGDFWQDGVTAVQFELLGENDVTMNCLYTTGQILRSPAIAEERGEQWEQSYDSRTFRIVARNQDSYYGTVQTNRDIVLEGDGAQTAAFAADQTVNDTAILTATPREGYIVDHWEYLSGNDESGQNVWTTLQNTYSDDPNVCMVRYEDFIENSGSEDMAGGIGSTIVVRPVYDASKGSNARVMVDVQSTEDDTKPQNAEVTVLTAEEKRLTGVSTMGGIAYDTAKGSELTLRVTGYDPLDWAFDGWYAYTLDSLGAKTLGEKLSSEEAYQVTPSENQYLLARLKPRTGALVFLDAAGGTAQDESQLKTQRAEDDGMIYLPKVTREGRKFGAWVSNKGGYYPDGGIRVEAKDQAVYTALWGYENPTVMVLAEEGGTTSGSVENVAPGTQVTVTAYPDEGWRFDHWEKRLTGEKNLVPVEGAGAEYTFTMEEKMVILCAVFAKVDPVTPGEEEKPESTPAPDAGNAPSHSGHDAAGAQSAADTAASAASAETTPESAAGNAQSVTGAPAANGSKAGADRAENAGSLAEAGSAAESEAEIPGEEDTGEKPDSAASEAAVQEEQNQPAAGSGTLLLGIVAVCGIGLVVLYKRRKK